MPEDKGYDQPTTKYPAEGAPVTKHGGNDAIHDGIESPGPGMGTSEENPANKR